MSLALSGDPATPRGLLALVVTPDDAFVIRLPAPGAAMLRALNSAVGGYIEAIGGSDWCCYVNEDGKRLNQVPNPGATYLARDLGFPFHPADGIVGPAVFLGRTGAAESDLPEWVLARARGILNRPDLEVPA
jgi:hypothetical protein